MKPTRATAPHTGTRRHRGRRAAGALLALASLVGFVATPAGAASASGTLSARRGHDAFSTELTVIGTFPMSQQQARDILAQNPLITIDYMGDDPYFDDLLVVRYSRANIGNPTYLSLSDQGLALYHRDDFETMYLNEDPEGHDEVYVHVRLSTNGRTIARFNSYPITGYF